MTASRLKQEQSTYKEAFNFYPRKARPLAVTNNYKIHVCTNNSYYAIVQYSAIYPGEFCKYTLKIWYQIAIKLWATIYNVNLNTIACRRASS